MKLYRVVPTSVLDWPSHAHMCACREHEGKLWTVATATGRLLNFLNLYAFIFILPTSCPRLRSSPGRYNISTLAVSTLRVVILKSLAMEISFPPSPSQHQESEWKMCAKLLDKEADEEPRRWWDSHPLLRAALIFPFA